MERKSMKSLNKALDILGLFLNSQNEMALAEIARQANLNKPTVHRIVSTLVARNYLKQQKKGDKYSLGKIYLHFSQMIEKQTSLRKIAAPYLKKLSQLTHETVTLAYVDESGVFFAEAFQEAFQSDVILRIGYNKFSNIPLHGTSLGKIALAEMPDEELKKYFKDTSRKRYTPKTITNINEMKKHLTDVRRNGVAFDDEEYNLGVRSIAASLRNNDNRLVGVFSIVAPSVRLSRPKMQKLVPIVKDYAMKISRELGFNFG
jgi:IclR family KDG regulon transcriptional repressor